MKGKLLIAALGFTALAAVLAAAGTGSDNEPQDRQHPWISDTKDPDKEPQTIRTGVGDVTVHLNGGLDVAYVGDTNFIEFYIANDDMLMGMSIGFEFSIGRDFAFDPNHGGAGHYVKEWNDAVGAFDLGGTLESPAFNNITPDSILFGGAAIVNGLPANSSRLCYTMAVFLPTGQWSLPNGFCIDNVFIPPAGTWEFHDGGGSYPPTFQGNPNASENNPDAPPVCFDIIGRLDSAITLDTVYGLNPSGQLAAGEDLEFVMRWTYTTGNPILGFTNGFEIYSPDGATWQPIVLDTFSLGWSSMFDLVMIINYFSVTGSGADTAGIGGARMMAPGLTPPFDSLAWWIETKVSSADIGKHVCIDSAFFPPSGLWLWSGSGFGFPPQWDGPHCFEIGPGGPLDSAITLDTVNGLNSAGQLIAGADLEFVMRWSYSSGNPVLGFTNGFEVYSPDGATWQPLVLDTFSLGWSSMFDLILSINYFSNTGSGADTAAIGGAAMMGPGITSPFDNPAWWIETKVSSADIGKHLCIDSAYFPPSGVWLWAGSGFSFPPAWDGPHCFEIGSVKDTVRCEPQGGSNPTHPPTYWYDVFPTASGRCDFHVEVFDSIAGNYTNWQEPAGWTHIVHKVGGKWWVSWWSPGCADPIHTWTRFSFDNDHLSTWSDWRTTTDGSSNPYAWVVDSSANHSTEADGYGYRVHVPSLAVVRDTVVCEPQGGGNPTHPPTFWYDVTPGGAGRCDFHVKVQDGVYSHYRNWVEPAGWRHSLHRVGTDWWVSWWNPGCANAIFTATRFSFDNQSDNVWGDWVTTISGTYDPSSQVVDLSGNHTGDPDGYGYRVHVPYFQEGPYPDSSITLDDVHGLYGPGQITGGDTIRLFLRITYQTGNPIGGMSNGFRIYSPDGATWQPIVLDTVPIGWPSMFDLGIFINYFGNTGSGADTVGFGAVKIIQSGMVPPFSTQGYWIETMVSVGDAHKHLCLDSAFFPPAGEWLWAPDGGGNTVYPYWDGPHCFEIVAPCIPPLRGNVDYDPGDNTNIVDLTFLVNYLFGGGAPPPSDEEADVNADGAVNIVDVTYLVAYLFAGGPPPLPCP